MTRFTAFMLAPLPALLLCVVQAQAAELVASVDRARLNSGETIELTLESNDVTQFGKPDLAPLEPLFEVRGTRQVNQLNTLNGDNQATTRWIVTLLPLHNGTLVIPPLKLGDVQSQPITVQVVESDTQANPNKQAAVFIDASLDQTSVYVQAQAILTLRIYHSVSLYDDSSLPPLQIPDARIEQLGESRTYEKDINGIRHGVIEMRYAMYPQHSGELMIPGQIFNAALVDAQPVQDASAQSPKSGKLMRVSSGEILLTVKAKPITYPADLPWLPARSLTLSESWNPEPDHVQVGDSLTRSLTVKAEGLASSQLPPLPGTEVSGLRRYPDQPVLGNQNSERGLVGSREDREALVPSRSGAIELPSVEVVWWNTFEDHLEHSSLPARTLAGGGQSQPDGRHPARHLATGQQCQQRNPLALETQHPDPGLHHPAGVRPLVAGTLATGDLRAAQTGPSPRTVLDDLKRACQANDSHATRQALDAWARQQPETLADMAARFVPLSDALDGLNGALYSETGQHWQGEDLWRAIRTIPIAERVQDPVGDSGLPPLYPK